MGSLPHSQFAKVQAAGQFLETDRFEIQQLWDALPVGVIVHAADGKIAHINQTAISLLGRHVGPELTLENFSVYVNLYILATDQLYPTERLPAVQALAGNQVCLEDLEIRQANLRLILQARATPVRDGSGHISHAIVTLLDITARMQSVVVATRYNQVLEHQVQLQTAELKQEILVRQNVEADLRQNQTRFETLSEAVPGVIYSLLTKPDGTMALEYANRRIETFFEAAIADILAAPQQFWSQQMHPDDRPGFEAELARCSQAATIFSYEWRSTTPSGTLRWLQTRAQPELRNNGELCWHGLLLDITERKQTELQLQESNAKNEAILMAIPDLVMQINRQGYYVGCIRNNPEISILPPNVAFGNSHIADFLPPDLAAHQLQMVQLALDTGTLQVYEQKLMVRERLQHEEVRVVPCGEDIVLLIVRDMSDRKAFELALKESEAKHRAIITALPDLLFRVSSEGYWIDYVHTNGTIDCLPKSYSPAGHHISDHLPPEVANQQLQKIKQALATGEMQVFEQQLTLGDRIQHEEVRIVPNGKDEVLFIVRDISDRKMAEIAFKQSEAENRAILSAIPDLMFRLHRDGTFLAYFKNRNTQDLLDKTADPVGHNIADFAGENEFYRSHIANQMQAVHQVLNDRTMMVYEQAIPVDGGVHHEEVRIVPSGEDEALVIIQNIDDRKGAELALQQSEAQKRAILKAIPDLMFYMRQDGQILDYLGGSNFRDLFKDDERQVGRNLLEYATTEELTVHLERKMQAMHRALATGEMQLYEQETIIDGVLQHEEVRVVPVNNEEVLVMIRDISDRKRIEAELRLVNERLAKLSLTDSLTTLANRRSLDEHLEREWLRALREQEPLSFILFDLDYFKRFNDTYGHQKGDACLKQVAKAASEIVSRSSDLVARYGGEEFAIVLSNTDLKGAFLIAQRIRESILKLQIPHQSSDAHPFVTASLGVSAIIPPPHSQPNVLIRQADQALYSAKQAGRNNCQCFISRSPNSDDC